MKRLNWLWRCAAVSGFLACGLPACSSSGDAATGGGATGSGGSGSSSATTSGSSATASESSATTSAATTSSGAGGGKPAIEHVLLISVDGLHAVDLDRYVAMNPGSAMAALAKSGVTYTAASTAKPSDSFPGLLAMITGGSPKSTGVYYDDSYDRALSPPGSSCATTGTEVVFDESIDINPDAIDGGGGIDPTKLPLDPKNGCKPVYPHQFVRVNNIFEVAKAAKLRTAWADKHLAYDLVQGPSGAGVDDLFTPEIAANNATSTVTATEAYDDTKVKAILNEIAGKDHTGAASAPVPAIFGMNFQAVSVAQKLAGAGYTDASGAPSDALKGALDHVDASLGQMVSALKSGGLWSSTLIVLTAKHGNSPIDPAKRKIVDSKTIPSLIEAAQPGLLAQATQDDIALLWLTDASKADAVVAALQAGSAQASIGAVLSGPALVAQFGDPATDSRAPDVIVTPDAGVIYTKPSATKIAEHGGFADDDTHVALLVAAASFTAAKVTTPVQTTQIAPTILAALGLDPATLQAVALEKTAPLPDLPSH